MGYPAGVPVVAVVAALAVGGVARHVRPVLALMAAWTVPATVVGYLLVSAPDVLEQLLMTGGF